MYHRYYRQETIEQMNESENNNLSYLLQLHNHRESHNLELQKNYNEYCASPRYMAAKSDRNTELMNILFQERHHPKFSIIYVILSTIIFVLISFLTVKFI